MNFTELLNDQGWIQSFILMTTRLGVITLVAPPFASTQIPATIRVALVLSISTLMVGTSPIARLPHELPIDAMTKAISAEFVLGLAMGLGVALAFAAFTAGAQILDLQIGFSMSQVLDPLTQQRLPILGSAFAQLGVLTFIVTDGHHAILRGLALSLENFPLGHGAQVAVTAAALIKQGGALFALGFAMVAPVVFCLFLTELTLGVIARNLPQMNVFALGMSIKVMVGLAALSVWVLAAGPVLARIHAQAFEAWKAILRS